MNKDELSAFLVELANEICKGTNLTYTALVGSVHIHAPEHDLLDPHGDLLAWLYYDGKDGIEINFSQSGNGEQGYFSLEKLNPIEVRKSLIRSFTSVTKAKMKEAQQEYKHQKNRLKLLKESK